METIYTKILQLLKEDRKVALCTIVAAQGSAPLPVGSKMIVLDDGSIFGTIGGGKLEHGVIGDALKVIAEGKASLSHHDLKKHHEMCCGGNVDIFIEPVMKNKKLFVFGAGHVGRAVVKHTLDLDMDILVFDDRKEIFNDWDAGNYKTKVAAYKEMLPGLIFDDATFIVIATYDHDTDREILAYCLKKPHAYLGMIGSKNKVATTRRNFLQSGNFSEDELNAVDMPIGININATTADEIAISIVARMIKEKNK
ncbi:MAG: XdhC family protein [Bacteroidales bacterium]|nr:XdhC family protein [Bacteroidales bacterium]MCF6341665.1 XdhC family protein [Bacteroidales bacterium]